MNTKEAVAKRILQLCEEKFYKIDRDGDDIFFNLKKLEANLDKYLSSDDELVERL